MDNRISSISEIQEAIKEQLETNSFFTEKNIPIICENSKTIEYEIKSAMQKLGCAVTIATPSLSFRGNYSTELSSVSISDPFWEMTSLNVVIVENPTLNRGKLVYATALDTALQVAYSLKDIPNIGLGNIIQTTQNGVVVVTVTMKSNIGFMLNNSGLSSYVQ